jgi:virulence factor Mce-like protein
MSTVTRSQRATRSSAFRREPRRRRRDTRRPLAVAATGLLVIGLLLAVAYAALKAPDGLPFLSYHTYYVDVPDPGNIEPHNDVRIGGVRVGQVISLGSSGSDTRIELKLSGSTRLPVGTKVFIRAQGLLGARYIQLVPGLSHRPLPDEATLTGGPDSLTYGIPDALNTLDPPTRTALGESLTALGGGLLGRGDDLGAALQAAPPAAHAFKTVVDAVLSIPGAAARLVPSLETAGAALDASRADIASGFAPEAAALRPFVAERAAFAETLASAPPALTNAQAGLDAGTQLLDAVRKLAGSVNADLTGAPAGLRAATALLAGSHVALSRASALLAEAQPAVPSLQELLQQASPLLDPVRTTLAKLLPVLDATGRHGCDIVGFGQSWRSLLGYGQSLPAQSVPLPNGYVGPETALRITPAIVPDAIQGLGSISALDHEQPYTPPCRFAFGSSYTQTIPGG